jgi:hypothetical protein
LKIYYLDKGSSSSQSKSFLALIPKEGRIFRGGNILLIKKFLQREKGKLKL